MNNNMPTRRDLLPSPDRNRGSCMNDRTLLCTELSGDDDTICRDDNRCRRRPSSLKTPNVSDIDIPDEIGFKYQKNSLILKKQFLSF